MDHSLFLEILYKILFLYSFILAGFVLGKSLDVKTDDTAKILIYFVVPVVIFFGAYKVNINLTIILSPVVILTLSALLTFIMLVFLKNIRNDNTPYIVAFMSGSINVGYLGLPIAIFIFPPDLVAIYMLTLMGTNICESIVGIYVLSRGHFSIQASLLKIIKMPILYAIVIGLTLNYQDIKIPKIFFTFEDYFKYSYSLLGMLLIGLGLARISNFKIDNFFVFWPLVGSYMIWPLMVFVMQSIDYAFFNFFDPSLYRIFYLMSIMPIAANSVAMASIFKYNVDKVSLSLVINTLVGLAYIPFMIYILDLG